MSERKIVNLYSLFKDTPKKLKIVCDWDEVIQPLEPYATWLIRECGNRENFELIKDIWEWEAKLHKFGKFVPFWRDFWDRESKYIIEYSPYGSKMWSSNMEGLKRQIEIKNSPNFYQQAPFLTIAEDLLRLIREGKVERLIFSSAYDKRKFPEGDPRKKEIFKETFSKLDVMKLDENLTKEDIRNGKLDWKKHFEPSSCDISLELIPFDSELLEKADFHQTLDNKTKGQWIRENIPNVDIVIDDNPNICKEILDTTRLCKECRETMVGDNAPSGLPKCKTGKCIKIKATIITPYYPAIENQHDERVLLVKNEVSGLKKEDFK